MALKSLFSTKDKVLDLPTRRKIFFIVKIFAGCHFREIERRSKLSPGLVKYHLDYLAKKELIKQERRGQNVRYFPCEILGEEKKLLGILRTKSYRDIIINLIEKEGLTHRDLVLKVGLSPSTISWHIKKLIDHGIIMVRKHEKSKYYLIVDKEILIKLLISYKETFFDKVVDNAVKMWDI